MSKKYQAGQYTPPNGGIVESHANLALLGYFAGVPTASISGYEVGAIGVDVTNGAWYKNTGSTTAATWTRQDTGGISTLAVSTITGNAAGTTIAVTDRMTTTDGVASGTAKVIGGVAFASTTSSTAVASTSAETAFDQSYTIPAATLKVGTVVKIKYWGIQTALVGTDTLRIRAFIGGTGGTAIADNTATVGVSNGFFQGDAVITCRTTGTSGTAVVTSQAQVQVATGTTLVFKNLAGNSFTVNTTTGQAVVVAATFNTANANSCRLDGLVVEIY